MTSDLARQVVEDHHHDDNLFGVAEFATLQELQEKSPDQSLHMLQRWLDVNEYSSSSSSCRFVWQVNRSHVERLVRWLTTNKEVNMHVEGVLHIHRSTSLLLLTSSSFSCSISDCRHQLDTACWYVHPHVHRIVPVRPDEHRLVHGDLTTHVVPSILRHVRRHILPTTHTDTARVVVRLFAFPVSLQTPLLRRLWGHIDRKTSPPSTGLDFARDRATHVLSVVQVTTGHDDDDVYLMGDVEAIENNATATDTHDSHDDWRIALYYIYRPIRDVMEQVDLHRSLCRTLDLCGRIRISHEGINGVLSGTLANLQEYERQFRRTIHDVTTGDPVENDDEIGDSYPHRLDMKYCRLRRDLPARDQLFDSLTVRETKTVINLFDGTPSPPPSDATNKSNRYRRRRERKRTVRQEHQPPKDDTSCTSNVQNPSPSLRQAVMDVPLRSATHLSSREWNAKLDDVHDPEKALLVDARNCYESRVGHFRHPTAPTLLTNTRKYSDLVRVLADDPRLRDDNRRKVFLYCTGGVRCERVGMLVRRLYPHKEVYQLKGGIQTYLKECHEGGSGDGTPMPSAQYFVGKNFVFDPRRTDPVHFGQVVGTCLDCGTACDDYDNGHAPNEGREARCNGCRMLVLLCNDCRPRWACHGEEDNDNPRIHCRLDRCSHEGAAPEPQLIHGATSQTDIANNRIQNHSNAFVEPTIRRSVNSSANGSIVSRAYWKLKEAWERYDHHDAVKQIRLQKNISQLVAVDCGAAPGGWTQFLVDDLKCDLVYAIDPAPLSKTVSDSNHAQKIRHMAVKVDQALGILAKELGHGSSTSSPVSIWVCDVNARDKSFVVDALLQAVKCGVVGQGTMFVLTMKCAHGHSAKTFDLLVQQQVNRLKEWDKDVIGDHTCRFEGIQILHLFSNRTRERTVMGYCTFAA